MAVATPDLCPRSRQKEDGKAKGHASSVPFKKSTREPHPVLPLHLIGHNWVTRPSLDQSLEGVWGERGRGGAWINWPTVSATGGRSQRHTQPSAPGHGSQPVQKWPP